MIARALGWILVAAAVAALAAGAFAWVEDGAFVRAGNLWFELDRTSLVLAQAAIQRYVWPTLWDPIIATALRWPAFLVLGVPAFLLLLLGYRRRRRRR